MHYIYLVGKPCSGKGTIAHMLKSEYGFYHFQTSALVKKLIIEQYGEDSHEMKRMLSGDLVKIHNLEGAIYEVVNESIDKYHGVIFDGYPRDVEQWEAHKKYFSNIKKIIIKLHVDDEESIKRMSKRIICNNCGYIQARISLSEVISCIVCDSSDLFVRKDDNVEVMKHRLEVYRTMSEIIDFSSDSNAVIYNIDVNCELSLIINKVKNIIREETC